MNEQITPMKHTAAPTMKGTWNVDRRADASWVSSRPRRLATPCWMVMSTWIPATSPTCIASIWAADITPISLAATSLAMVELVDGMATPMPRPERASATRIMISGVPVTQQAKITIDTVSMIDPAMVEVRSPILTAR